MDGAFRRWRFMSLGPNILLENVQSALNIQKKRKILTQNSWILLVVYKFAMYSHSQSQVLFLCPACNKIRIGWVSPICQTLNVSWCHSCCSFAVFDETYRHRHVSGTCRHREFTWILNVQMFKCLSVTHRRLHSLIFLWFFLCFKATVQ